MPKDIEQCPSDTERLAALLAQLESLSDRVEFLADHAAGRDACADSFIAKQLSNIKSDIDETIAKYQEADHATN